MDRSYYAIIPANVRYDKELTANAKLLYGEITALCNEKGYCWATNNYFAELYGVSKTSTSKWIKQLIDKGYIKSRIKYKAGTKEIEERQLYLGIIPIEEKLKGYTTNVKDPIEEKLNTPIEEKLKDNTTLINNTSNIKKERKNGLKSYEEIVNNYTNNEKLRTEIFEFIKMRKLIKSPMTDKALNLMINKLNKLSNNNDELKISILDQSIENSWKGIFELKDVKSNGVISNNTGNKQSSNKPKYNFSDI